MDLLKLFQAGRDGNGPSALDLYLEDAGFGKPLPGVRTEEDR